jgi:hypothetical protein
VDDARADPSRAFRLDRDGDEALPPLRVITGYRAVVDHAKLRNVIEAFCRAALRRRDRSLISRARSARYPSSSRRSRSQATRTHSSTSVSASFSHLKRVIDDNWLHPPSTVLDPLSSMRYTGTVVASLCAKRFVGAADARGRGYGADRPRTGDRELVLADVAKELVSPEAAEREYGVREQVLDSSLGEREVVVA